MKVRGYAVTVTARKLYFVLNPEQEMTYPSWDYSQKDFFMPTRQKRIRLSLVSGILFAGIIIAMLVFSQPSQHSSSETVSTPTSQPQQTENTSAATFSYQGRTGENAMTLLEEKTTVEKAPSGFVTAINGRKAEDSKKEFWAFYVNGKQAQVGASDYQTKDTDQIEWKIETY